MDEILPGLFHWSAYHEGIRQDVHSHFAADARALIDPMLPDEGLDWFEGDRRPEVILLTNRHHYRHSGRFVEAFGCEVRCHEAGLHEFSGTDVRGFAPGDEAAPGIVVLEVGAICPDEAALHLVDAGALSVADGVIAGDGGLAFVPDFLMGDDPEEVKRGLREAYARIAGEVEFDALLMAHGPPVTEGARQALRDFAS
ncbi:MAG TPA: hypothetical protein VGF25_04160 [Thermoleophilaceae bacterium]|jgi:hypothetical protein